MLIHVATSAIADATSASATARKSTECIDHLLCAHHECAHIVRIAPEDIDRLLKGSPRLSPDAFAVLQRIAATAMELEGLQADLAWHLELGVGHAFDGQFLPRSGGGQVIRANLHHFHPRQCVQKTVLLAEHVTDANLYFRIAEIFIVAGGLGDLRLSAERHGGGGSGFAGEYVVYADEGRIILAIADGDQRYPNGPHGKTWKGLDSVAREHPAFQRARTIGVREAENLISLDAYEAIVAQKNEKDPRLLSIKRLRQLNPRERAHADFKKGLTLYQLDQWPDGPEKQMWSDMSERLRRDRCTKNSRDECTTLEDCGCFVVNPISTGILADVVAWLHREPAQRVAKLLQLSDNEHLKQICEEVVAWACVPPELIT